MNTNNLVAEATEIIGDVIEVREGQEEMNFGAAGIKTVEEEANTFFLWDAVGIRKVEDGVENFVIAGNLKDSIISVDNNKLRKLHQNMSEEERQKTIEDQQNDEWYVKHRGIAYNFGAAGINVIGEDE